MGGKISLPAADPMTIQQGKRAFARAISDIQLR